MMNAKAQELGLDSTHFITPHGLDMPEHYTTAFELAKMADYALNIEKFANIVNTKSITISINDRSKTLTNTNELLGNLYGVNGVKTGFTNGANRCLVTSINRDGMNIITAVLGADTKKDRTNEDVYKRQDYNTYVPYEKFKAGVSKVLHVIGKAVGYVLGMETEKDTGDPQFGMLYFEDDLYIDADGDDLNAKKMGFLDSVETDVEAKTMTFRVWEAPFKHTNYTYSMEGWTARYGKPLELSLTLHLATMAPDLVCLLYTSRCV